METPRVSTYTHRAHGLTYQSVKGPDNVKGRYPPPEATGPDHAAGLLLKHVLYWNDSCLRRNSDDPAPSRSYHKKSTRTEDYGAIGPRRPDTSSHYFYSALGILVIGIIVAAVAITPLYSRLKANAENSLTHAARISTIAVDEILSRARDLALQITSRTQIRKRLEFALPESPVLMQNDELTAACA